MIGIAYSCVNSGIKFKDNLDGNKLDINSNVASIYGRQCITDNLSLNAAVSLGKSTINAKRQENLTLSQELLSLRLRILVIMQNLRRATTLRVKQLR